MSSKSGLLRQDGRTRGEVGARRWRVRLAALAGLVGAYAASPALAAQVVSCGGAVALGAAQLACSHVQPKAPAQICTFSWALFSTAGGQKVAEGSFMLPPGASNVQIYQGAGFDRALSEPIVLCQAQ